MRVYGFPGQGSQAVGMGRDLFDRFPEETDIADTVLGYSIRALCLDGPSERLCRTDFTQPAMYVVGALTYLDRARNGAGEPDFFVGHSLGEYVALFGAGAFDFETGLRLVRSRGDLMSRVTGGGMAAVLGCDRSAVQHMLRSAGVTSIDIANINSQRQTVLAGPADDIARLAPVVGAREGLAYVPLEVSAPFHSRYMRTIEQAFDRELAAVEFAPLRVPVIANVSALPYGKGDARQTLRDQVCSPVNWLDTVKYLMREGDFRFEELGPGAVLSRLVREIREWYAHRRLRAAVGV